jgi:hypothetical protein
VQFVLPPALHRPRSSSPGPGAIHCGRRFRTIESQTISYANILTAVARTLVRVSSRWPPSHSPHHSDVDARRGRTCDALPSYWGTRRDCRHSRGHSPSFGTSNYAPRSAPGDTKMSRSHAQMCGSSKMSGCVGSLNAVLSDGASARNGVRGRLYGLSQGIITECGAQQSIRFRRTDESIRHCGEPSSN